MNLSEWRDNRRVVLLLDGLELHFRRVSLLDMATQGGDIPAPLAGLVQELIDGTAVKGNSGLEEWRRYAPVIDKMLVLASVGDVRVTTTPTDDSVGVGEIPFELKSRVFASLTSSGEVKPFRGVKTPTLEAP